MRDPEVEVRTRTADAPDWHASGDCRLKGRDAGAPVCAIRNMHQCAQALFNVPARRKFLKSDNVELSNIMREFERLRLGQQSDTSVH